MSTIFDVGGIIGGIIAGILSDKTGKPASTCAIMLVKWKIICSVGAISDWTVQPLKTELDNLR